eukprot:5146659-Pyramimonas_sp.AAC.1
MASLGCWLNSRVWRLVEVASCGVRSKVELGCIVRGCGPAHETQMFSFEQVCRMAQLSTDLRLRRLEVGWSRDLRVVNIRLSRARGQAERSTPERQCGLL